MIDEATQAALRAAYNPEGSALRRHQLLLLEMLSWLDGVCRRHGIAYWLSSGTLLGAVRHGGFIPWDDDVDVELPLGDYRRLLGALSAEAPAAGYAVQTSQTDPEFLFPYAKLRATGGRALAEADGLDALQAYHGAFIDIFPMAPSGSLRLHRLGAKLLGSELKLRVARPGLRWLLRPLRALMGGVAYPLLRALSPLGAGDRLRHVAPSYFPRERIASECLPAATISFEGRAFGAPARPDLYLSRIYGPDYMQLPATIHTHLAPQS